MALQKCHECRKRVSTEAKSCPSCGAPVKKRAQNNSAAVGCATIIIIIVFVVIITGMLNSNGKTQNSRQINAQNFETAKQQATSDQDEISATITSIPSDVTYSVIDSHKLLDIKRSLSIRLNKKVSEETLHAIAHKLKSQDSKTYERTFIVYYLPDMHVNAGAWATTHFNPDLEVRIRGLTIEQEKVMRQLPVDQSRDVIGVWLDETPIVASRIVIFRQVNRYFAESTFSDGSTLKEEIILKPSSEALGSI